MHELDQQQLRRAHDRVASNYEAADFFCAEVRSRLLERLDYVDLEPKVILDLGAGTGNGSTLLQERFPQALIVAADWSEAMLEAGQYRGTRFCADGHRLPIADESVDIVFANLLLPCSDSPETLIAEAQRVLRNPGLFLFTTLGPDTLDEVRAAWAEIDAGPHVHRFADMHNVGDTLVKAGFREPVMDVENLTITYGEAHKLFAELRAIAATNFSRERRDSLTPKGLWQSFLAALDRRRTADNRLPVSVELITGQAWTGAPAAGVPLQDGEAHFPVSRLKY